MNKSDQQNKKQQNIVLFKVIFWLELVNYMCFLLTETTKFQLLFKSSERGRDKITDPEHQLFGKTYTEN